MQGHRIVLPEGINIAEPLPLIVIGAGKQLVLKNTIIVHADSLPACLQLGPGARLVAESKDKVTMVKGSDPNMPEDLQVWDLSGGSSARLFEFQAAHSAHKEDSCLYAIHDAAGPEFYSGYEMIESKISTTQ